jgi:hypothetical protein
MKNTTKDIIFALVISFMLGYTLSMCIFYFGITADIRNGAMEDKGYFYKAPSYCVGNIYGDSLRCRSVGNITCEPIINKSGVFCSEATT